MEQGVLVIGFCSTGHWDEESKKKVIEKIEQALSTCRKAPRHESGSISFFKNAVFLDKEQLHIMLNERKIFKD